MNRNTAPRVAVFRCDASATIGGGHVMRCLALADELARYGWRSTFAVRGGTLETVPALASSGQTIVDLEVAPSAEANWLAANGGPCDLLVVDHYERGSDFEAACRGWADNILVLDDANERNHDCDILVCPSPTLDAADFSSRVPAGSTVLTGPAHAPLRAAFADRRFSLDTAKPAGASQLLIALSATDPSNATGRVLAILQAAGLLDDIDTDVILGPGAPHLDAVACQIAALPRARLHVDPPDAIALMAGATVTVGAAGTTAWERCALGAAMIVVSIADNQRPGARHLADAGAAIDLGPLETLTDTELTNTLLPLLNDPDRRADMIGYAAALCDGLGAARVAATIDPPIATDGEAVYLRPATMDDTETIHSWQTNPEIRRYARDPSPPEQSTHLGWMTQTLHDPLKILSLVMHRGTPAGLVRLDRVAESDNAEEVFEVSIVIDLERQRLGLGGAALDLAHRLRPAATLIAEVHRDNSSSHELFRRSGYAATDGWYRKSPVIVENSQIAP